MFRTFFTKTLDPSQKTWRSVNKNNEKNGSQTYFRMIFRKFFEKKIGIFQKKIFFGSCYFIFRHGEKKKFFFRKNFDQNFGPKFYFYFCKGIVFFQNKIIFFNFFSLFIPQRTVLDPGESDPATSPHYEGAYWTPSSALHFKLSHEVRVV